MAQNQISVTDWKPMRKGALRGFASVSMPSGMIMREVSILQSNGRPLGIAAEQADDQRWKTRSW